MATSKRANIEDSIEAGYITSERARFVIFIY